ncbi:MAG TPA: hypothetical protein VJ803_06825 [Gemmatimonadaceae bacterium]|nr:hypothetical protein [Gemmatimonadaceae bacterium]
MASPPRASLLLALAAYLSMVAPPVAVRPLWAQGKDSSEVLRRAQDAQARFERYRVQHLPLSFGYGRPRCDEVIGRFCFWHDEGADQPPPEPHRIRVARDSLIAVLDRAAASLSGDAWIAGQRVRYLVEQERSVEALAAARTCAAETWWCRALQGLALHTAGDFAGANAAYDAALADMPEQERCAWNDISLLLEDPIHERYEESSCVEREDMENRFWWLAQPLHLVPGNDVRSEHFARITTARIEERSRTTHSLRWGNDLLELRIRYGWPTRWSRERPSTTSLNGPSTIGHEPSPSFYFLPSPGAIDQPLRASAGDWDFDADRPRHRYAPSYASHFAPLEHQAALFRRGDSLLIVAAYDVSRDTALAGAPLTAGLIVSARDPEVRIMTRLDSVVGGGALVAMAPDRPLLFSLEVVSEARRAAARARYAVHASSTGDALRLSELLLFQPRGELPTTLDEVLPTALGSLKLHQGSSVGLYWEVYGQPQAIEPLVATLDVEPVDRPALRRAVEAIGLAARPTRVKMRWQDGPSSVASAFARTLAVNLSSLRRGRYRMKLTVAGNDGPLLSTTRNIEIVDAERD